MVVQPSLPGRAKWASDLIERLEDSQRGIVRGIKTTGDMVLQKKPVDLWLDKVVGRGCATWRSVWVSCSS